MVGGWWVLGGGGGWVVWVGQCEKMSHKCKKQESFLLSFDLVDRIT